MEEPVQTALNSGPLIWLLFVVLAIAGIALQYMSTKPYTIEDYNRWEEYTATM